MSLNTKLTAKVKQLIKKYDSNDVMMQKLENYIMVTLPEMLDNTNNNNKMREKRKEELEKNSNMFMQTFFNKNKIFYNTTSECFFIYDGINYNLSKEDDIVHMILQNINEYKNIQDWKYKIKVSMMKKIKDHDILTHVPESETIQNVIQFVTNNLTHSRENSKYLLTIMGDILLKKNNNYFYFISSKAKPILKEFSNICCMLFGSNNIMNIFKFKYYEHKLEDSRIISINDTINMEIWNNYLKTTNGLNLFCVACYYSNRYNNADDFLIQNCKNDKLKDHALYLKNNNETNILNNFVNDCLEESSLEGSKMTISWKDMYYIWKQYINDKCIPNVFFNNKLKELLIKKLEYNDDVDEFVGVTSSIIPKISNLCDFMDNNIIYDDNEDLEIDELCNMFYFVYKQNISETEMLNLIKHFYNQYEIIENKFILNCKSKLWDKKKHIIETLQKYENNETDELLIITDLYNFYRTHNKSNKFITSKRYFETFLKSNFMVYIVDDGLIKSEFIFAL
jgi:hypothetical protein